ncbi:Uncharacterised protein [Mycobacteroides abscessus subsp. abscessus]|nr:Uncharacterised protein [Mycobacteroides abscessus subsp. abscessus]
MAKLLEAGPHGQDNNASLAESPACLTNSTSLVPSEDTKVAATPPLRSCCTRGAASA